MRSRDSGRRSGGRGSRGGSNAGWARDLGLVIALVAITNLVLFGVDAPQAVVWIFAVPFFLLLPGYAVVSALFPEDSGRIQRTEAAQPWHEPDHLVRLGLSLVTSAVILPVIGVVLSLASAISRGPVVVAVSSVIIVGVAIAAVRRLQVDPAERAMPFGDDSRVWGRATSGSGVQTGAALAALLVLVAMLAITGAVPSQGESYTEFYVLSEGENGNLTAQQFPQEFTSGQNETLHVGLENREHEPMSYEVVMLAQAVDENGSVVIQQQVDRFDAQLAHGENETFERNVAPTLVGQDVRLQILLYKGQAPDNPTASTADQKLQVWIDVVEG